MTISALSPGHTARRKGELADKTICGLNEEVIAKESMYDGSHVVCTSLTDYKVDHPDQQAALGDRGILSIRKASSRQFVYLSRDERIQAHFMTCFLSLILYRMLEKRLKGHFTCEDIIGQLRGMNFQQIKGSGYVPCYTRTDFTDALHEAFGFGQTMRSRHTNK